MPKTIGYNLSHTKEIPVVGRRVVTWMPACARLPEPGQRVVWMGMRGNQQDGTYRGDNQWDADPDETHEAPYQIRYTPTLWRPA